MSDDESQKLNQSKVKIHDNGEITVKGSVEDVDLRTDQMKQKEKNDLDREIRQIRRGLHKKRR